MIYRAKSSPTAHAAAQSLGAAIRTWALGALVLILFLIFRSDMQSGSEPECNHCVTPASQSASGGVSGRQ